MHHSHRERVDGVDERVVGLQLGVVVTDVDELTEKLRRKQHLEQASIALEAEEKAQRAERVRLQVSKHTVKVHVHLFDGNAHVQSSYKYSS